MVIPVPRFIASSSSSSSPRKAPVDATTYVHNTHVNIRQIRRDPMDVTLEDLIVDGLDQVRAAVFVRNVRHMLLEGAIHAVKLRISSCRKRRWLSFLHPPPS